VRKPETDARLHDAFVSHAHVGIVLALPYKQCSLDGNSRGDAPHTWLSKQNDLGPLMEDRHMRKVIIALMISAAIILSGISATTFTSGQFTSSVSADGSD
jgi:hypothetical protein